ARTQTPTLVEHSGAPCPVRLPVGGTASTVPDPRIVPAPLRTTPASGHVPPSISGRLPGLPAPAPTRQRCAAPGVLRDKRRLQGLLVPRQATPSRYILLPTRTHPGSVPASPANSRRWCVCSVVVVGLGHILSPWTMPLRAAAIPVISRRPCQRIYSRSPV